MRTYLLLSHSLKELIGNLAWKYYNLESYLFLKYKPPWHKKRSHVTPK